MTGPLKDFFSRDGALLALLLIVLYKLGDAFAGSLTTAFLIRGAGFSVTEVGAINKALGLVATIVGALAGGALMTRLSLLRRADAVRHPAGGHQPRVLVPGGHAQGVLVDGDGGRPREPLRRHGHRGVRRLPDGAVPRALLGDAVRAALGAGGRGAHLSRRAAVRA